MLKDWNRLEQPSKEEMEQRLKKARARLEQQQILMKEKKLPVLVLLEGWGAAGKVVCLERLLKISTRAFLKWQLWMSRQKKKHASRSYTVIL